MKIIDLSQEIYAGMPVFDGHPAVEMSVAVAHAAQPDTGDSSPVAASAHKLTIGEHVGTHVDAFNHFSPTLIAQSIDTMPLEMFITSSFCLDLSDKGLLDLIEMSDIELALRHAGVTISAGDTVLLYTDHYRHHFDTNEWPNGPGISEEVARWFGEQKIAAFGVETRSPGVRKVSNKGVHRICGEMGFTHYENLINLHQLVGMGRFQFIGLPLKIRGGTGSPVRAVAII